MTKISFLKGVATTALLLIGFGAQVALAQTPLDLSGTTLTVVTQSPQNIPGFDASGLFKDTPYKLNFAVVTGTSAVGISHRSCPSQRNKSSLNLGNCPVPKRLAEFTRNGGRTSV